MLDPFQTFLPGYGMDMALVTLTDDVNRQLDQGGIQLLYLLVYFIKFICCLSPEKSSVHIAMFYTVSYDLLTYHVAAIGIHETDLQWLISSLHWMGRVHWHRKSIFEELTNM